MSKDYNYNLFLFNRPDDYNYLFYTYIYAFDAGIV